LTFCILGIFSINNRMFDVWVMLVFGAIGFFLERCRVPLGPFIIGLVLAPMAESPLREGLMDSDGSLLPLVTRPISCTFLVIGAVSFCWSIYKELIQPAQVRARAKRDT
jgi:putative tricarboxylic transport membrane protein